MAEKYKSGSIKKGDRVKCPKCGKMATYNGWSFVVEGYGYRHGAKQIGRSSFMSVDSCYIYKDNDSRTAITQATGPAGESEQEK